MPLGTNELLIILGLAVLLFGGSKLPQLMRGAGEGLKEFKKATRDEDETPKKETGNETNTPVV